MYDYLFLINNAVHSLKLLQDHLKVSSIFLIDIAVCLYRRTLRLGLPSESCHRITASPIPH